MNFTVESIRACIRFSLFVLACLSFVMACGTQDGIRGENPDDFEELKMLISSGDYSIENQWAIPQNGTMVDLVGNFNFIRFRGDSVSLFLPYFGVRHTSVNYGGSDGGIRYEGLVNELGISEDTEKERILVDFEGSQGSENYDFRIILFSNGNSNTHVNSSARNSISYRGTVRSLPENKK